MADAPQNDGPDIGEQVRREVDRALQRNIKGLDFLLAGRQHVGTMEKEIIHRDGTAILYRYKPVEDEIFRVPLLIVSPPSNRGYIFDLAPDQSFVEYLLKRGYDVYNLDWNPPRRDEAKLAIEDYVDRFIPDSIERISKISGEQDVSLAGYCAGGTLAVIHSALYAGGPVKNILTFAAPLDFDHMPLFKAWGDREHFDVDYLVDAVGIVPPEIMLGAFDLARPANRPAGRVHLWTNMWNDEFVKSYRMFERWAAETLSVPGEYFRQLIKDLLWENRLARNTLEIGGRPVDLTKIDVPILNVVAQHDHVVAHAATQPLMTLTASTDREEIVAKGGHVSLVAGPAALKRLWPLIDEWLERRST
ncbi:poly-beta-hydroxybutyrate polymerase [Novosphingobium marinum]|uniref:Polyhydroxyalkanoate synthase n=1 Tax=Novosphingobium marinum TaxID=1514948 RepID=A0A7Y9XV06_9SPHN|nr:alpha/beta fold hydrolase [Novosphingobium marinum]NYH93743.1 polyhydroxyalkanoate synthase [Novosphingobium marinum]GGC16968.1 poly-beta-hydroxybutyrate polymerase [Novosphingobium marinum]